MGARIALGVVLVALIAAGVAAVFALTGSDGSQAGPPRHHPVAQRSTKAPTLTPTPSPATPKPEPSPSHKPTPTPSPTATTAPEPADLAQAFALWPNDTPEAAGAACSAAGSSWRDDPARVSLRFAAAELGWHRASVGDMEGAAGSTYVAVDKGNDEIVLSLTGGYPGGPGGYPGNRCYSVTEVRPSSMVARGRPIRISIKGVHARVSYSDLGAASIVVTVAHGTSSRSVIVHGGRAGLDLGYVPNRPGYVLILYRDSSGRDFAAAGTSLPAGNFSSN